MKINIKGLDTFVRNNPQHFKELNSRIENYFKSIPVKTCGFCPHAAPSPKNVQENFASFLLCDEETRKLILDKSKMLLDNDVEIEDFSVNDCGESNKNK